MTEKLGNSLTQWDESNDLLSETLAPDCLFKFEQITKAWLWRPVSKYDTKYYVPTSP